MIKACCYWNNHMVTLILAFLIMFVSWKNFYIVLDKLLVFGSSASVYFYLNSASLEVVMTFLSLSFTSTLATYIWFSMLMILLSLTTTHLFFIAILVSSILSLPQKIWLPLTTVLVLKFYQLQMVFSLVSSNMVEIFSLVLSYLMVSLSILPQLSLTTSLFMVLYFHISLFKDLLLVLSNTRPLYYTSRHCSCRQFY